MNLRSPFLRALPDESLGTAVVDEIRHQLATLTLSRYTHETLVEPADGLYDVDCSSWANIVLRAAAPAAYRQVATFANATRGTRFSTESTPRTGEVHHGPYAEDHVALLASLVPGPTTGPWQRLETVADLAPGDVLTYYLAVGAHDTGHVMFVMDAPVAEPGRPDFVRIEVADATDHPHGPTDGRHGNPANPGGVGIGVGPVLVGVDDEGRPTRDFCWTPTSAPRRHPDPVLLGRVR